MRLSRSIENIATEDPTNEQHGIKVQTRYKTVAGYTYQLSSNPYRAATAVTETDPTMGWTLSTAWSSGRRSEVETFSGSALPVAFGGSNQNSTGIVRTDIDANRTLVTDQAGKRRISKTNALGQLLRVDEPNAIGGTEEADLGTLALPHQPTSYRYDHYGKMVEVTQGVQKRWFRYDSLGRLNRVRQPEQEVNAGLNLPDTFNTSGQWTAGFTYDVMGNVLTATDANGVTITNTYDRAGRVKTRSYSGEPQGQTTPAVSFYYDGKGLAQQQTPHNFAKGKLTKVDNTVSETQYQLFDNLGRMTQMAQITDGQTYTSKYTYNFSGALIEEEYPSGRVVKNEFESDGDLLRVTSKKAAGSVLAPYVSNFSYTASGGISQMRLGNGRWETAKFNNRMQVTELGFGSSATDAGVWKTQYQYGELDANGNVVASKNTGNIARQTLTVPGTSFVQSYRYDSLYRLTEASETTGSSTNWSQSWSYDRYGNRIGFAQDIAGNTNAPNPSVDPNTNRFNAGQGFGYDANGNVVSDVDPLSSLPRQFIFNGDNKQTEVKRDGVTIGRYFYDGEGKRVRKVTDTETTIFVYSAGKLVAEYSTQLSHSPSIAYTTTDHLGTPRVITDQFGQVKARRDFMPFGEELYTGVGGRTGDTGLKYSSNQDDIRQKFTGYQKDNETGLDFAEARMYENRFGRFTAVDPLLASVKSANPQTFNRFIYVGNNPIMITDPLGLDWYRSGKKFRWSSDNKVFDHDGSTIGNDWTAVDFGSKGYYAYDCVGCEPGEKTYLYKIGGFDNGQRAAEIYDKLDEMTQHANSFNDPKYLALRDPQARDAASDVMGMGAAVLNVAPGTYNLAASGVNYLGGQLPYAPELSPDANSSSGQNLFFTGTNVAMAAQGGVSLFKGISSGINAIKSGGLSFSAYKALKEPSEVLGHIPTTTRDGRTINFLIQSEYSHMFISQATQRAYNLPNWTVNNRFNVWKLNSIQHALIDPQRFRFLPVGLKPQVGFASRYNFLTRTFQ